MARGGGAHGGRNNGGKGKYDSGGFGLAHNQFVHQESNDQVPGEDSSSPYYLSNGDHLDLHLISTPLICGFAKNKFYFVDGSVLQPLIDDTMVMSWILHFVSKDIAESIMYLDNAIDMWNDFYDRFYQGNNPRVFQMKQFLNSLIQGSGDVN